MTCMAAASTPMWGSSSGATARQMVATLLVTTLMCSSSAESRDPSSCKAQATNASPMLLQLHSRHEPSGYLPRAANEEEDEEHHEMPGLSHQPRTLAMLASHRIASALKQAADVSPYILWPVMFTCVVLACIGWLATAMAAQQGRFDCPSVNIPTPAMPSSCATGKPRALNPERREDQRNVGEAGPSQPSGPPRDAM
mmetsp:Transcript_35903/g.83555  ORF Transcript_35903/g.83555 Transcript_35903/m.83555 type:complete len:197 (+) Transcript_35903:149-739(+)|eukprot:CAMPEP_0171061760 /NCGR_PEP_ID=MMETSP0766_2-20121228/4650_1 /TAXON_ID=439317 /ORGANISM="Gambierdiscus australes, Strain CAWD 149" /LENGTH=196 /DNA_ID=CAMNT_0011517487 /DNA_START=149 /DNA_END=739 /DNA_ORIENTATION=-